MRTIARFNNKTAKMATLLVGLNSLRPRVHLSLADQRFFLQTREQLPNNNYNSYYIIVILKVKVQETAKENSIGEQLRI